jgi:hypothetical protein
MQEKYKFKICHQIHQIQQTTPPKIKKNGNTGVE